MQAERRADHPRGPRRLRAVYRGRRCAASTAATTCITMPPPSSGGVVLLETLNMLEDYDLPGHGRRLVAATCTTWPRRCGAASRPRALPRRSRFRHGDAARAPDLEGVRGRAARARSATPRLGVLAGELRVAGRERRRRRTSPWWTPTGNAVSFTYTLEDSYGSKIVVPGAGFLLNNEMGDFNAGPGLTDRDGPDRHRAEPRRPRQAAAVEHDADHRWRRTAGCCWWPAAPAAARSRTPCSERCST